MTKPTGRPHGRPPVPEDERRVYLTLRLARMTVEELDRLALPNEPRARTIDRLIAHYSQAYDPAGRPGTE